MEEQKLSVRQNADQGFCRHRGSKTEWWATFRLIYNMWSPTEAEVPELVILLGAPFHSSPAEQQRKQTAGQVQVGISVKWAIEKVLGKGCGRG